MAGVDVAIDRAVNGGDGDFDVGVNLPVVADDERAAFGLNLSGKMTVNSQHAFEDGLACQGRAVADETAQEPFFNIPRERLALRDGVRCRSSLRLWPVLRLWSLIRR